MRLICITDLHGKSSRLEQILALEPRADAIVLGGDLTHFGKPDEAQSLIEAARSHTPVVFALAGNCDSPAIEQRLVDLGVSLHGRGTTLEGVGFFGVSAMPHWRGSMYEFTEEQIDEFLSAGHLAVEKVRPTVLVSHTPPFNSGVDRTFLGKRAGSTAVRQWTERACPALVVCGHIHEARGTAAVGESVVVNCGPAKSGRYAVAWLGEKVSVELKKV
jgi:Icc-related predicted phosphoesterase